VQRLLMKKRQQAGGSSDEVETVNPMRRGDGRSGPGSPSPVPQRGSSAGLLRQRGTADPPVDVCEAEAALGQRIRSTVRLAAASAWRSLKACMLP